MFILGNKLTESWFQIVFNYCIVRHHNITIIWEIENMYLACYHRVIGINKSGSFGEWEILWEHELQVIVYTAFLSSRKFSWVFLINLIETQRSDFFFLLENSAMSKRKTTCQLWLSKCKFSLLVPSLPQQLVVVLFLSSYRNSQRYGHSLLLLGICFPV